MKRICSILVTILMCGSFISCEKTGFSLNWEEGIWCLTSEKDYETGQLHDARNDILWYWELSNGFFTYYELCNYDDGATYNDGVLTTPKNANWTKALEGKYTLEDGRLLVSDMVMYHFTKLSKDKVKLDDSTILAEGIAERVKKINY